MREITALTVQKHNPNRISVFLDGEFAFGLESAAAAELKVGKKLSDELIGRLLQANRYEEGKQHALRFVSLRPRSEAEVRRNLLRNGYDEGVADQVLARLRALELLDDKAFASYWIEQRATFRPRGAAALAYELRQKGVEQPIIDGALADHDDESAARRVGAKQARRWSGVSYGEFRAKMGQYLQRRGFRHDTIRTVTDELWASKSDDGRQAEPRGSEEA